MRATTRILLVALAAGCAGLVAGVLFNPGGLAPLLVGTEGGQRMLQAMMAMRAPGPPAGLKIAARGQRLPGLQLADMDGNAVELPRHFAGRPLLVNVWATWCGPCIREMPELQRFSQENASNGAQVVGIALDDAASVEAFLRHTPVDYPILLDTPGPADAGVRLGNPKGVLPYSVLISADGRLLKQRIGPFRPGEISRWARD